MEKDSLFTDMKPAKALAKMALPTVGSQIVMWSLDGLVWSQLVADAANSIVAYLVFKKVNKEICISS